MKNVPWPKCTYFGTHTINMYFGAVMIYWRERCSQAGITVKYKMARTLVGDQIAKLHLWEVRVPESQFAGDVTVHATI